MQQHDYREDPNPESHAPRVPNQGFTPVDPNVVGATEPAPRQPNRNLTIGRIVHYQLDNGPSAGQFRPAIVVRVWDAGNPGSAVQLAVFTDAGNDDMLSVVWKTSVTHGSQPGQYLWPSETKPGDS